MKTAACFLLSIFLAIAAHAALVGNQFVQRDIEIRDGKIVSSSIHNLLTKKTIPIHSEEFQLSLEGVPLLTAADFRITSVSPEGNGLVASREWVFNSDSYQLSVIVKYTADASTPYLRKTIQVNNLCEIPLVLRWIDVERLTVNGEAISYSANPEFPTLTDYGQPVFLDSIWFGLEHPAANTAADKSGVISLRHHPGIELKKGESFESFPAILGACAQGAARPAFEDYVLQLKYYPGLPRVFFWWNGFRVIKPPDRLPQGLKMVECLLERLQKPYCPVFDGFSYDAGFDMYQPQGLWVPNEETIWKETSRALWGSSTGLGFWASFSCIFDTNTHEWGRTRGFGLQHPTAYCLAEPLYHEAAKRRLLDIVEQNDMRVISFDGMYLGQGYGCNTPGHDHLVSDGPDAGKYGTEAVAKAEIDIFRAIRKIQPEIDIDFFVCGEWTSPWWLTVVDGVHSVPGDTVGTHIISPSLRDELITARDIQAFNLHRRQNRPFPQWAEDLYGFQVRSDHLIDGVTAVNENYAEKWENEYVLGFAGRGTITSYIACADLLLLEKTTTGLKFLADVNNWVRHNREMYLHTNYILGEPEQGEVCGYAHGNRENRCLIALHNPVIDSRKVTISIDARLDLKQSDRAYRVNIIYPYHASLGDVRWNGEIALPVHGYEVVLLDIRRDDLESPQFPPLSLGELPPPTLRVNSLTAQEKKISVEATLEVPQDTKSPELWVYFCPDEKISYSIDCMIDGKPVTAQIHSRSRDAREEAWFQIPLNLGKNSVALSIPAGKKNRFGAWLRAVFPASSQTGIGNSLEPLMPALPEGFRHQYWEVAGMQGLGD